MAGLGRGSCWTSDWCLAANHFWKYGIQWRIADGESSCWLALLEGGNVAMIDCTLLYRGAQVRCGVRLVFYWGYCRFHCKYRTRWDDMVTSLRSGRTLFQTWVQTFWSTLNNIASPFSCMMGEWRPNYIWKRNIPSMKVWTDLELQLSLSVYSIIIII